MARLLDPRNGDAFDLPSTTAPPRTWIVASVPRSGSTLLCRVLWDTGGVGAPKEYLNPMQLRDWEVRLGSSGAARFGYGLLRGPAVALARGAGWDRARLAAHLARVRARRSDASGRFGIKIHYHHFRRWFLDRGWAVEDLLAPYRWVRIVREDRVAQAVSWARALQTGRWASRQRSLAPAFYRAGQIDRLIQAIEEQEAGWEGFFARRAIVPLRITYEELVTDPRATVRGVLAHLGVEGAEAADVAPADLRPQADELNARWVARYRASHPLAAPGSP